MTRAEWRRNRVIHQFYPPGFSGSRAERHRRLCGDIDGWTALQIWRRPLAAAVSPAAGDCPTFDAVKGF
jgi:hypothetical protein